ncbi:MAG: hypothetical protein M0042_01010 [Nitrospiraceae bacterium]|nr:hypothetical protein [Nitrospiraceae bacterium]
MILRSLRRLWVLSVIAVFGAAVAAWPADAEGPSPVEAFYLKKMPAKYASQEAYISGIADSGANTVLADLPLLPDGTPDTLGLSNLVYLVHRAKLKIFIILPVRALPHVVEAHPAWEDRSFDLAERSVKPSDKIDLFNDEAVAYLRDYVKTVSAYAVDGFLLGPDVLYSPGDGMGKSALKTAESAKGFSPSPKKMFLEVKDAPGTLKVNKEYEELFGKWQEMKRDRIRSVVEELRTASRAAGGSPRFGMPLPVTGTTMTSADLLAHYALDVTMMRNAGMDYFWSVIAYRDIMKQQNMPYRQAIELVGRSAFAAMNAVKDVRQCLVVIQASSADGVSLSTAEIEEVVGIVRKSGTAGIALQVTPLALPSPVLAKKLFRLPGE